MLGGTNSGLQALRAMSFVAILFYCKGIDCLKTKFPDIYLILKIHNLLVQYGKGQQWTLLNMMLLDIIFDIKQNVMLLESDTA